MEFKDSLFRGKRLGDMTKEELLAAIEFLIGEREHNQKMHQQDLERAYAMSEGG